MINTAKNYQIPLCEECWHINFSTNTKDCIFFIKNGMANPPFTKETASIGDPKSEYRKEPLIDYKKNTCRHFKDKKTMEGKGRGPTWRDKEDTRIANKRTHADRMNSYNHGYGYEDS
jgi:hypothetical protein